jgi:hypothetical protein
MRKGRVRGERVAAVLATLAVLSVAAATVPIRATATDSDLKHSFAFKVEASNGYEIIAFAASQRADGKGEIGLIVSREDAHAFYVAPASLTATRIEADLGRLGEVSLDVVPSGKTRRLRSSCRGEAPEPASFERQSYRGTFEFNGEEGYTAAASSSPPEYNRFFLGLICGGAGGGEVTARTLPGARLRLLSQRGSSRLDLRVNKNHPAARARFEVEVREERAGIAISRSRTLWAGAGAFRYDRALEMATLTPPAPFSGQARFRREVGAEVWSGNLAVDLPGRSKVPLTGAAVEASLVGARLSR